MAAKPMTVHERISHYTAKNGSLTALLSSGDRVSFMTLTPRQKRRIVHKHKLGRQWLPGG